MGGRETLAARIAVALFVTCAAGIAVGEIDAREKAAQLTWPRADPVIAGTVPTVPTAVAPARVAAPAPAAPRVTSVKRPARPEAHRVGLDRSPDEVGRDALAMISYPWQQRLHATITFAGPRDDTRAHSAIHDQREVITVYVRQTDTPRTVAVTIAHEIGHLVDYRHLTDADRSEWLKARGRPDVTWWTCEYCTDYGVGSGDFAETFAAWQVGPIDFLSEIAPFPSPEQLRDLTRFFR